MTIASSKALLISTAIVVVITLANLIWQIDLSCTHLFFSDDLGVPLFPLKSAPWVKFIYHTVPVVSFLLPTPFALAILWRSPRSRRARRAIALVAATVLLGAGLLVNGIVKPLWGHPRPYEVVEFGGNHRYQPAPWPAPGYWGRSFPSGHAAGASALLVVAMVWRRKPALLLAILAFITATSVGRIVAGGHFLTDVIWGIYLSYLCSWLLYHGSIHLRCRFHLNNSQRHQSVRMLAASLLLATPFTFPYQHCQGMFNALAQGVNPLIDVQTVAASSQDLDIPDKIDKPQATTSPQVTP